MSIILKTTAIIFLFIICIVILYLVRKEKISVKYSIVWLLPVSLLILFIMLPKLLLFITSVLGFQTASNMIFALLISLLMIISVALTVIVTKQKEQIRVLIQEVSLLKSRNRK